MATGTNSTFRTISQIAPPKDEVRVERKPDVPNPHTEELLEELIRVNDEATKKSEFPEASHESKA